MELENVFRSFAGGPEMEGRSFVKLLKVITDTGSKMFCSLFLLGHQNYRWQIYNHGCGFSLCQSKERRMQKNHFLTVWEGDRRGSKEKGSGGWRNSGENRGFWWSTYVSLNLGYGHNFFLEFRGTHTEAVRFYDDKSLFTGVHQHGGKHLTNLSLACEFMRTSYCSWIAGPSTVSSSVCDLSGNFSLSRSV